MLAGASIDALDPERTHVPLLVCGDGAGLRI